MPKASPIQNAFNAGEFSPKMFGRTDYEKYPSGLATCLNWLPTIQGPLVRRSGTQFIAEVKDSTKATRVIPFVFSTTQAYIIELDDQFMRFYKDKGQIISGTPVQVATPWLEADLFQLKYAQSADLLYAVHPSYAPRKITRTSHTAWTITEIDFQDGPYLVTNPTDTTLTPSGTTGSITLTASAITGINNDTGFQATDVGRLVRFKDAAGNWSWLKITAHTSTTVVTATIEGADLSATTATAFWRLGVWSETTGYPASVTFYQDRLVFGGGVSSPQRIDFSETGQYEYFAPSDPDGTVADDHAIPITLNANDVNVIRWLMDDEKALLVGTNGGEWAITPSTQNEVLTPTNRKGARTSQRGSADIQAIKAGESALFIQRARKKLRNMAYAIQKDGYTANDMTKLADHITGDGMVELAYQQEPLSLVWAVRDDGTLLGFTFDQDENVTGWHRHILGGQSDADGTQPIVESVAVIPSDNQDQVWLVVKRYIDGSTVRYIECLNDIWTTGDDQEDAIYLDCSVSGTGPATTFSGADHLEGETVCVLVDGATHPDVTVSGGQFTINYSGTNVHAGYGYNSDGKTLRATAGAADGTAQGKTKRIHRVTFRFLESLGFKYGPDENTLDTITFRTSSNPTNEAVPLFTGDKSVAWPGGYDKEGEVFFRCDQPLPCTLVALMPQLNTQDR